MSYGSIPNSALGQKFVDQQKNLIAHSFTKNPRFPAKLMILFDQDIIEEQPPPDWLLEIMEEENFKRYWALVSIVGFEEEGPQYIPCDIPVYKLAEYGNALNVLNLVQQEMICIVEMPGNRLSESRIVDLNIPPTQMLEEDHRGFVSSMQSSRVYSILGI